MRQRREIGQNTTHPAQQDGENAISRPVPAPALNFFVRFLSNPDETALRRLFINLLDLEISRAQYNVLSEPALFEPSEDYRSDILQAERALNFARRAKVADPALFDLRYFWLTLLGHRLAAERDLPAGGLTALVYVASAKLSLPLRETEAWSEGRLFRRYTETVLREEWDYFGIQFRYPRSAWPPEKA